ncbi:hypothetical protein CDD80_6526 [Ophiocordyceps camponoti-rufipedis]|uniref:LIM zinc-binding domain-containing protein n=1 Tax=Ophiocordyceps camponoti-rufipedis TaxID=2004952 RepID=A0A2C5XEQ5_9HYPO|nr:hypothetical protein CDD80_6526 [Ophiocordyceps camponoti-rufipedis]
MDPLSPREQPDQRPLSPDAQPAESTTISMANSDPFTCTFCRGTSAGRPRVLGRSARLACEACHSALLNLSICWVCGEMIVRGDECVSLGWCFWHRACYGCLLCGCRRLCSGVPVAGDGSIEVAEPPLCAMCVVDVEADGLDELSMVQRGLRHGKGRRDEGSSAVQGAAAGGATMPTTTTSTTSTTIWVDIHDPVNGSSFTPGPLKPVPPFMRAGGHDNGASSSSWELGQ